MGSKMRRKIVRQKEEVRRLEKRELQAKNEAVKKKTSEEQIAVEAQRRLKSEYLKKVSEVAKRKTHSEKQLSKTKVVFGKSTNSSGPYASDLWVSCVSIVFATIFCIISVVVCCCCKQKVSADIEEDQIPVVQPPERPPELVSGRTPRSFEAYMEKARQKL